MCLKLVVLSFAFDTQLNKLPCIAMQEARYAAALLEAGAGEEAAQQPQSSRSPEAAWRTAGVKRCGLALCPDHLLHTPASCLPAGKCALCEACHYYSTIPHRLIETHNTSALPHCREGDALEHAPIGKRVSLGQERPVRSASATPCPGDASHSEDASCSADARESNAAEASGEIEEVEEVVASSPLSMLTGTGGRPARS